MAPLAPDLAAELGNELGALVQTIGVPLVDVTTLSRRGAATRATALRLQFADGRVLKGTLLESADQAREVDEVAGHLDHHGVPRVLGRAGAAVLTAWVDGTCLASVKCTVAMLRECGAFQGDVHRRPVPPERARVAAELLERWRRRLRHDVAEMVGARLLTPDLGRRTSEIALRFAPADCDIGYVLGDFCAENIVRRESGELCVVDNETLSIGPRDYDLGRTWYRWPMTPARRRAFLQGYGTCRDPATFLAHFPYWAMQALVHGAVFRHRMGSDTVVVPLRRLRALVKDLERGVPSDAAVFRS
jgi:hypothetical protein